MALVVHGNAYLQGEGQATAFPATNSTLTFCEFVKFVDLSRSGANSHETAFAQDAASWLQELRKSGVQAIRMTHGPSKQNLVGTTDRMLVGFIGGGGRWLLETTGTNGSDYWEGRWELGDRDRADKKIWQVTYGRIATNHVSSPQTSIDLESMRQRLAKNLTDICAFARRRNLEGFANAFASGLANLGSSTPGIALYHSDLLTPEMSLAAAQLISAAESSWVFGGMGSWNDLGFEGEDQTTYEDLSEDLYNLVNESLCSAANSTASLVAAFPQPELRMRSWWRFWA